MSREIAALTALRESRRGECADELYLRTRERALRLLEALAVR